jgi:hypothetical protein
VLEWQCSVAVSVTASFGSCEERGLRVKAVVMHGLHLRGVTIGRTVGACCSCAVSAYWYVVLTVRLLGPPVRGTVGVCPGEHSHVAHRG